MKFPEITGNFTCPINFPTQGHVIFTGHFHEYQKFYMSCTFLTEGYVTFTLQVLEISCHAHFQLKNM